MKYACSIACTSCTKRSQWPIPPGDRESISTDHAGPLASGFGRSVPKCASEKNRHVFSDSTLPTFRPRHAPTLPHAEPELPQDLSRPKLVACLTRQATSVVKRRKIDFRNLPFRRPPIQALLLYRLPANASRASRSPRSATIGHVSRLPHPPHDGLPYMRRTFDADAGLLAVESWPSGHAEELAAVADAPARYACHRGRSAEPPARRNTWPAEGADSTVPCIQIWTRASSSQRSPIRAVVSVHDLSNTHHTSAYHSNERGACNTPVAIAIDRETRVRQRGATRRNKGRGAHSAMRFFPTLVGTARALTRASR